MDNEKSLKLLQTLSYLCAEMGPSEMTRRRKYMVFPMHVSSLSHESGPYTGIHPYVRGRMHAPKTPYITSRRPCESFKYFSIKLLLGDCQKVLNQKHGQKIQNLLKGKLYK